ncbi:TonB family protein [Carboxylicivirga sp. M1479]|uniref:TonB family protein n=1 Tax=Carboxylicivirga sp. M1479 TaxID=2594476 RepID=UPI001178A428|nr:TonB family protein [Carboxylicivirga sp. M1479]TRX65878.1 TonB family protein [Carboxylicivirga sp. M1479]
MKALIKACTIAFALIIGISVSAQVKLPDINIYEVVDKSPRLKGSGNDLGEYIRKQIDYNDSYKLKGVEGDVWVSFVVSSHGEVKQVEVEKGVDSQLDKEVVEAILATKKWKPGELNKQKVNTQMQLAVRFTLTNYERQIALQIKALDEAGKRPLFVLNNEMIDGIMMIEDYNVESVRILKGDKAIRLYGERAENGVVVITSKNGTPPLY